MQTTIDPLTPFTASVDKSLISVASNFFDNSTPSIMRELMQNSRRAGATKVSLYQQGKRWCYSDNGAGCDPSEMLGLGTSRWEPGVRTSETPAGCGFFALARRKPKVICPSRNWQVELTEAHFNGQEVIAPTVIPDDDMLVEDVGTGIIIEFDGEAHSYFDGAHALRDSAIFMPFDFFVNGKRETSHGDFMAKPAGSIASKMFQFSAGVQVRVDLVKGGGNYGTACYHGFTVSLAHSVQQSFGCVGDSNYSLRVSVMVTRESALPLELPQRNKMVKSDTSKALSNAALCAGLELAAEHLKDISLASPSLWLDARVIGYTGPVLYPKFIGHLVTRSGIAEMADYTLRSTDDTVGENSRYVTIDEFEEGDFLIAPDDEILELIAQTTIPASWEGGKHTLGIDTDEYFAPGLRLVEPLSSVKGTGVGPPESEGYAWRKRVYDLKVARSGWCETVQVVATGTSDKGELSFEGGAPYRCFDDENLYDDIRLEFWSDDDDQKHISLPAAALFRISGDSDDGSVEFIITKKWLDNMAASFPGELAYLIYEARGCSRRDGDDDCETADGIADTIRTAFAKFEGLDDFLQRRLLDDVIDRTDKMIHKLETPPGKIVLTIEMSSGRITSNAKSSCVIVPPFVPFYNFHGNFGDVACDEQGNRDPDSAAYPEYASFDVASMKLIGLEPGKCAVDIVGACGWHDSTKKIYVTPSWAHLLWAVSFLDAPYRELDSYATRNALVALLKLDRVSSDLYSALWYDAQPLAKLAAGEATGFLPPIRKLWIYGEAP